MASMRRAAAINGHRVLRHSSSAATKPFRFSSTAPPPLCQLNPPSPSTIRAGFLSNYSTTQSYDIDLSNEESKRRLFNRLLYRSRQRGFLELDLVLGKWVEENIHLMDESGIKSLLHVLDLENPDLWKWLTSQGQPPEALSVNPVFCAIRDKITNNLNSYAAPETRAIPGQPWVRGWDDIKKGPGGPVAGNQ